MDADEVNIVVCRHTIFKPLILLSAKKSPVLAIRASVEGPQGGYPL